MEKVFNKLTDYSEQGIINELKRIASILAKNTVTRSDLKKYGKVSYDTIKRKFKGGLCAALKKAELNYREDHRFQSDEELLKELQRIWEIVLLKENRRPYQTDLRKYGSKFTKDPYVRRFGSWLKACQYLLDWEEGQLKLKEVRKAPTVNKPTKDIIMSRSIPLKIRMQVLKRDNFKCVLCGKSPAIHHGVILHIDHIIPFSKGGRSEIDNLQTLCQDCNLGKGKDEL